MFTRLHRQILHNASMSSAGTHKFDTKDYDFCMTLVELANDEGDFGTTLLLSHHLLQFPMLSNEWKRVASISYKLLNRKLYSGITLVHNQHRWRKNLSQLQSDGQPEIDSSASLSSESKQADDDDDVMIVSVSSASPASVEVISSLSKYQAALADFRAFSGQFTSVSPSLTHHFCVAFKAFAMAAPRQRLRPSSRNSLSQSPRRRNQPSARGSKIDSLERVKSARSLGLLTCHMIRVDIIIACRRV